MYRPIPISIIAYSGKLSISFKFIPATNDTAPKKSIIKNSVFLFLKCMKYLVYVGKSKYSSGDSLYKVLPVTLDFAKVLSRMSKQDEAIYDKPYDFRYFM